MTPPPAPTWALPPMMGEDGKRDGRQVMTYREMLALEGAAA